MENSKGDGKRPGIPVPNTETCRNVRYSRADRSKSLERARKQLESLVIERTAIQAEMQKMLHTIINTNRDNIMRREEETQKQLRDDKKKV